MPNQEDDNSKLILTLTQDLKHSMQQLKRAYNEYKEGEDKEGENADAILDDI